MKKLLLIISLIPALAAAHGNHPETSSNALHGFAHLGLNLQTFGFVAVLLAVVYFLFKK